MVPKIALVTGGAGFLGTHLCHELLKRNYKVICVDDLSTGQKKNIAALIELKNFQFIQANVVHRSLHFETIDVIYHLACPASPIHYQKNPLKTIETAFLGTRQMLELAREHQALFFQASTSEIYGDPLEHPQRESYCGHVNTMGPRACYDESKRLAETLCIEYARTFGFDVKIARIFNTYGPNMHSNDGRVVSNFIIQALQNLPLTIYGNGSQTRSLCYVADLIQGILDLTEHKSFSGPVNLGQDEEMTILDLAKRIIALTKSSSTIKYQKLPQDDPKQRKPDLALARAMLNWKPTVSLDQGLKKTILYFEKELRGELMTYSLEAGEEI